MAASTWPAFTWSPAATVTAVTVPGEVKLRLSVFAAAIVPTAETVLARSPRVTVTSWFVVVTAVDPDAPLVTSTHTRPAEHPFQLVLEGGAHIMGLQ